MIFKLSYQYTDPLIAKKVLLSALNNLILINENLELSNQKEILKIIDTPSLVQKPVKPNKILILVLTIMLSSLLGSIFVIISNILKKEN